MPAERNAFKLGITIIMFFILLLGVLYFLAPKGGGDMVLFIRFPHNQFATEIKPGGLVFCGGDKVGSVRSLQLAEMQEGDSGIKQLYTLIKIKVNSSLGLRKDCKIRPEGLILGGAGKLVIDDRGIGEPVEPEQIIDGQPVSDISALTRQLSAQLDPKDPTSLLAMIKAQLDAADSRSLLGKIHASLDDINAVTQSISNEFNAEEKAALLAKLHNIMDHMNDITRLLRDEMDQSIDQALLAKLHGTLSTLNSGLGTVTAMLEENREPIADTVGHIRGTTQILEQQIAARIAQQLDPQETAGLLAKVHVAIDHLGSALEDISTVSGATREMVVLNKEQLNRMIGNLKETSDHLKAASKDIRRNPWRLFYQPTIEEAAQANVFDAARAFSEAANRLDDAAVRLQALSEASAGQIDREDKQLNGVLEELQMTFDHFKKAEDALWEQLNIK